MFIPVVKREWNVLSSFYWENRKMRRFNIKNNTKTLRLKWKRKLYNLKEKYGV
jgi:hypothetical protein